MVQQLTRDERGVSLIEVMIAMLVLVVGMLPLVGVTAVAVRRAGESSPMLIAREKAREAIESVHTARDTGQLTWQKIQNVAAGGVFLGGAQSVRVAGPDGLVNTADDGVVETVRSAGADGILNNADDVITTLKNYTREIRITPLNFDGTNNVNPGLRQIQVVVRYQVQGTWQNYTITTYISSYS
jgi:prepilin-type N-terminal cleavage/methylation domain-containing protein